MRVTVIRFVEHLGMCKGPFFNYVRVFGPFFDHATTLIGKKKNSLDHSFKLPKIF